MYSYQLNKSMGLEHLHHLVELLISPIRAQLADAPLNRGLADVWCLHGLRRQQRPWLTDVVKNACHQPAPMLSSSFWSQRRCCLVVIAIALGALVHYSAGASGSGLNRSSRSNSSALDLLWHPYSCFRESRNSICLLFISIVTF